MTIPLGRPSPDASRDRPGWRRGNTPGPQRACHPYLVLLPVGFALPPPLPAARCALTAPFHPCRPLRPKAPWARRYVSVALSLGLPPPGVTRHRACVEPGLSSLRYSRRAAIRPSGMGSCGIAPFAVKAAAANRPRIAPRQAWRLIGRRRRVSCRARIGPPRGPAICAGEPP